MQQLEKTAISDFRKEILSGGSSTVRGSAPRRIRLRNETAIIALLIFVWAFVLLLMFKPFRQPEQGDPSIYDYIAQCILRGRLPYVDAIDPKAPGAMYLSAVALLLGRLVHLPDIFTVRLVNISLYAALPVVTFFVARALLKDTLSAILAAAVLLLSSRFPLMMIAGTQPKLPMVLFGTITLLSIYGDRPFLAGAASMLACLCWQPGLMYTGIAVLFFSKHLTSWKDRRAIKVLAGAIIPLAAILLYFHWRGGLSELIRWTFTYDYSVYMPTDERPLLKALAHFWKVIRHVFGRELPVFYVAAAGLAWYIVRRFWTLLKHPDRLSRDSLFGDAVALPPIIYFAFCMINMQSGPDLIPFIPFFGIFCALLVLTISRKSSAAQRVRTSPSISRWQTCFLLFVLVFVVFDAMKIARKYKVERPTLSDQYTDLASVTRYLKPGDSIYAHGSTELLVFLNQENLNPYLSFDTRADDYIGARTPGGFAAVISRMESQAPKIVVLTGLSHVKHRKELENWVSKHYDLIHAPSLLAVYVRKPAQAAPVESP